MLTYLIYFAGILAFLGSVWLLGKAGCAREVRYRHAFLPLLAVVYIVGALVSYGPTGSGLWLAVGGFQADHATFAQVNTSFLVNVAYNVLFLLGFVLVKRF